MDKVLRARERGQSHLIVEIHRVIDRHAEEYHVTPLEVIGALELIKQELLDLFQEDDEDEPEFGG